MSDILSAYLHFTEETESPTQFHRWSFLSCVAAALGKRVWIPFGHGKIYPNMYVMLVGVPGTRKSSAISIAKKILEDSGYVNFGFTKTTKEKFLLDFEEGFDLKSADGSFDMKAALDKPVVAMCGQEVYINCDEFVDFIGQNNINFINLLTTLWDNLPEYQERLKNSKSVHIKEPVVNILGGITPTSFAAAMPPEVVGQGFLSRLILVHSEPSRRKITWPPPPDQAIRAEMVQFFSALQGLEGEMKVSKEARAVVDKIYKSWPQLADARLQYYGARRLTHLLKLAMLVAACDNTLIITQAHIVEANTILTWTENKMHMALGEFGESRNSKAAQKIIESLTNAQEPVQLGELWKAVSMDLERHAQMVELIQNLRAAGKVEFLDMPGGTRVQLKKAESHANRFGVNYATYIAEYSNTPDEHLELLDACTVSESSPLGD